MKYIIILLLSIIFLVGCGNSSPTTTTSSGQYGTVLITGSSTATFSPSYCSVVSTTISSTTRTTVSWSGTTGGLTLYINNASNSIDISSNLILYTYVLQGNTFNIVYNGGYVINASTSGIAINQVNRTVSFTNAIVNGDGILSPASNTASLNGTLKY